MSENRKLIHTIKGEKTLTWIEFLDAVHTEHKELERLLKRNWNSNAEKVLTQSETRYKELHGIGEQIVSILYPNEKDIYLGNYELTIVVKKS